MYTLNPNYKLVKFDDYSLLVDITEKQYGKSENVLSLDSSGVHIFEMLQSQSFCQIVDILLNEEDNIFSKAEIEANVTSVISILSNSGVIIDTLSNNNTSSSTDLEVVNFGVIKGQLMTKRQPLIGVVEITPKCNCNCPHCYVKGFNDCNWLSTEQFLQIAHILRNKGIINITITGGEPFLHPDFKTIYLEFKKLGFLIDIFTNAILINEDLADFLAEYPPRSLDITLYGLSDNDYYKFTGVNNGFTSLCNALRLLKERELFFTTKMILHKDNYEGIASYNKFALEFNAPFRYNVVIGQGNNTLEDPNQISLSNDQIIKIEQRDPIRKKILNHLALKCSCLPFDCSGSSWSQYPCGAGLDKVFISYDGKMSPCMTLRGKGLGIFKYGYDKIWEYWGGKRKERMPSDFKCIDCKYLPICTPCTEEFEQLNGDKTIPLQKQCELAELRWEKLLKLPK